MRKVLTTVIAFCIFCGLLALGLVLVNSPEKDNLQIIENSVCAMTEPVTFSTIEDFILSLPASLSDNTETLSNTYRKLLQIPVDGYTLKNVSYCESAYVAATYYLNGYEGANSYDDERNSTAIYEITSFENAEEALRINYIEKGSFEPVEYNGKTYYYCPEYASSGNFVGHSFGFIADGELMYVHLPGLYTLDEALELLY